MVIPEKQNEWGKQGRIFRDEKIIVDFENIEKNINPNEFNLKILEQAEEEQVKDKNIILKEFRKLEMIQFIYKIFTVMIGILIV